MQKALRIGALAAIVAFLLPASTLRQLTLDDLIRQSTVIVRGTVQPGAATLRGSMIFTHYTVQIEEIYKGPAATLIDFGVPGGTLNGITQRYAGTPALIPGQDYVLFLWTSKTGLTQVIGLSQGLFSVILVEGSAPMVVRAAAAERMLNSVGQPVLDNDIRMPLSDLKTQIQNVLSGQGAR